MKTIAENFGLGNDKHRSGVVTFSYNAELSIALSDFNTREAFNQAVDNIPLMGSITRIDKALRVAQKELFVEANGARPDAHKVVILLTDGSQTPAQDAEDPGNITDEMRAAGISIIVVGIGMGTDPKELDHMAGGDGQSFRAESFDALSEILEGDFIEDIKAKSCPTESKLNTSAVFWCCFLSFFCAVFYASFPVLFSVFFLLFLIC